MQKNSRVTKKRIAEQLGLSMATIDRAFNNRGNVKPETYQRIMEASRELDYSVNKSASLLSRKKEISMAVVLLDYPQVFWEQVEKGVWDAYHELCDYGLHVEVMRLASNPVDGVNQVQEIIHSGRFDALALPAGDDSYIDLIDKSIDGGFPICTLNIDSPMSKRLFYVGCNYNNSGRVAAELLCKLIGRSGKVALVTDSWTSFLAQQKITGFREVLADYPDVKLVGPLKMDRENITESLAALESDLISVDGIYVSNAESENVAKLQIKSSTVLISHDMNKEIYRLINAGIITATICQDPVSQGYLAVKKMFNHLALDEEIGVREKITTTEIVMKENARFYV